MNEHEEKAQLDMWLRASRLENEALYVSSIASILPDRIDADSRKMLREARDLLNTALIHLDRKQAA